jgi:secreted trypsin-like serine protease
MILVSISAVVFWEGSMEPKANRRQTIRILLVIACSGGLLAGIAQVSGQEQILLGNRKIVGGIPTTVKEHPWQIVVRIIRSEKKYLCGGSAIRDRWILTAAHCLGDGKNKATVLIKVGVDDYEKEGAWQAIDAMVVNPRYDTKSYAHDVALLRVRNSLNAQVIPLAADATPLNVGEEFVVTGHGATTNGGGMSSTLLKAFVPYVSNAVCNAPNAYNDQILPSMMCAGRTGVDACQGDSGGPLQKGAQPETAILVGVVSVGIGCGAPNKYGVYARVSAERDWIVATAK